MKKAIKERRKYQRYDTEAEIYFRVAYDIKTKVRFQLVDKVKNKVLSEKYLATSKNISAESLCFSSERKLTKGDELFLEVYLPSEKNPINMEGVVVWSQSTTSGKRKDHKFDTAVKLTVVNLNPVTDSIYYDEINHVTWSIALESIFGSFRKLAQKIHSH